MRCHMCILEFALIYVNRFRNAPRGRRFSTCRLSLLSIMPIIRVIRCHIGILAYLHAWFRLINACRSLSERPPWQEAPRLLSLSGKHI